MTRTLITGASAGIGQALAIELAKREHEVVAVARNAEALDELRKRYPAITTVQADITKHDDRVRIQNAAGSQLDVLVNNAAACWPAPLEHQSEDQVQTTLDVGVVAPILLTRMVLPSLRSTKGLVVNMSSIAGRIGSPGNSAYTATKFAIDGFSESLAYEVAEHHVRVRAILPSYVATQINANVIAIPTDSPYYAFAQATQARLSGSNNAGIPVDTTAEAIADVIDESLRSDTPFLRVPLDDKARDMVTERSATEDHEWYQRFAASIDQWR